MTEMDDKEVLQILEPLRVCASAIEVNGPAQRMMAYELAAFGKPVDQLTLAEVAMAYDRTHVRYHRIYGYHNAHAAESE